MGEYTLNRDFLKQQILRRSSVVSLDKLFVGCTVPTGFYLLWCRVMPIVFHSYTVVAAKAADDLHIHNFNIILHKTLFTHETRQVVVRCVQTDIFFLLHIKKLEEDVKIKLKI